jgi:drug/metabolite transporter (DMT)-like permease
MAMVFLVPILVWRGTDILRGIDIKLYLTRGGISLFSMGAWFYAVALVPIADLTAIQFLSPIFATVCAALFLGEIVRLRRWTATLVGFVGAMVILRPGVEAISLGTMVALVSAFLGGINSVLIKRLANRDHPDAVVFLTFALLMPLTFVPAVSVWQWLSWELWAVFLAIGLVGTIGHMMFVRAFAAADASLVMTFDFSKLPFTAALGYLWFGEVTTGWTWLGATIIFASGLYIARREAALKRAALRKNLRDSLPDGSR